ncbi:hypothetical protein ACFV23_09405, partial [Streptomyces sp. NPDC059627]
PPAADRFHREFRCAARSHPAVSPHARITPSDNPLRIYAHSMPQACMRELPAIEARFASLG